MPAKFNILVAASIPLVPLIPLLACGGDSKSPDASIHVIDGSGSGSGSATCHIASSLGTPTFAQQGAQYTAGSAADATNVLAWQGQMANQQAVEVLIFGGCGSGSGSACGGNPTPDWPTTFGPKSNLNLMTAPDAIIAVLADLSGQQYQTIYISTGGTLNITQAGNAAGTTFAGNASNVTLQHYDFTQTGASPDPDNCMSTMTSLTFSGSAQFNGKVVVLDGTDRDAALRNYLTHRFQ